MLWNRLNRHQILAQLKANLQLAQQRMKQFADKHRVEEHFKLGDMVFVKLQPYRQISVSKEYTHKLSKRYIGPFPIIR